MLLLFKSSFSIVKLLNNYRSHPTIIRFPSDQFYDGELEACGDRSSIGSCLNLELLESSKYPVIFSAVEGNDMRESSSPSFFNPEEVLQVKAYVQQLLADTRAVPRIGKCYYSLIKIDSQSSQRAGAYWNHRTLPCTMHEASPNVRANRS
jgi:hypothetical protein